MTPPGSSSLRRVGCLLALGVVCLFGALMLPLYFGLREAFFSPPVNLSGARFDAAHIAHVAAESGIVFPSGTVGLEYHYQHGQDPYGFAKLAVPADKAEAMVARPKRGSSRGHGAISDPGLAWWQPGKLTKPREVAGSEAANRVVWAVTGAEAERCVVYVAWFYF